jgi:predicted RNase H-like HicB family nuclease
MVTVEYPAMVYKNNRNRVFVANCYMKNMVGFGKTENDAINNLKSTLQKGLEEQCNIIIKPTSNLLSAQ